MDFLDIPNVITLVKYQAERFSSEHPQHSEDVSTFVRELDRITSELQSAVYARQKAERGW
jgi:ABC-type Zn uptake system ZnuABC Zn-binding protein ZnuA